MRLLEDSTAFTRNKHKTANHQYAYKIDKKDIHLNSPNMLL